MLGRSFAPSFGRVRKRARDPLLAPLREQNLGPWMLSEELLNAYYQHYGSIIRSKVKRAPDSLGILSEIRKVESAHNEPLFKTIPDFTQAKNVWFLSKERLYSPKQAISSGRVVLGDYDLQSLQYKEEVKRREGIRQLTFPEKELDAYYEYYGSIIRDKPPEKTIPAMVEATERARENAILKYVPIAVQARRVAYLAREGLRSLQQAISSGRVKIKELQTFRTPDEKAAAPSVVKKDPHLREWWNETLGEEQMEQKLAEMQNWLYNHETVKKFVITRPEKFWMQKEHWTSDEAYPRRAEYYIFTQALEILTDCIYDFFNQHMPVYLIREEIESPQDKPLVSWLELLREQLSTGDLQIKHVQGSLSDFQELSIQVRDMRNMVQHKKVGRGGRSTWKELAERMMSAVEFAKLLGDERRVDQLQGLLDELKEGPQLINFLKERHTNLRRQEVEMGVFERFLIVLLQDFREKRVKFQDDIYKIRIQSKNDFSVDIRERALEIRNSGSKPEKYLPVETHWSQPKVVTGLEEASKKDESKSTLETKPKESEVEKDESKESGIEKDESKEDKVETMPKESGIEKDESKEDKVETMPKESGIEKDESKEDKVETMPKESGIEKDESKEDKVETMPKESGIEKDESKEDKVETAPVKKLQAYYVMEEDDSLLEPDEQKGPGVDATKEKPNDEDLDFAQDTMDGSIGTRLF